jgi:hypothetical protein
MGFGSRRGQHWQRQSQGRLARTRHFEGPGAVVLLNAIVHKEGEIVKLFEAMAATMRDPHKVWHMLKELGRETRKFGEAVDEFASPDEEERKR